MSRIPLLSLAILFACSSDDLTMDHTDAAIARASVYCASSSGQLVWLRLLIEESEKDVSKRGIIYTFQSNGQTIFMHQPWIMSCMGCIMYDCHGNRLELSDIDQAVLSKGFQDLMVIYEPVM